MARMVCLLCTAPVLRKGLENILLAGGWGVAHDEDPDGCDAMLVLVRTSRGVAEVRGARERAAALPLVALTDYRDADLTVDVLAAGATSVIPLDLPEPVTLAAIELAVAGVSAIESSSLAWLIDHGAGRPDITDSERGWLARLDAGLTIAELAVDAGYSERSLYRQLNSLYHRLGVHDRSAAIAEARRRGVL